ncbi:MAG: hypothetical protein OXH98_15185 [Caldilineaceae bacterium]|nr:hypothetical protein [Caldilineaceae bacterium]
MTRLMPKDRSYVRASDIAAWSFCQRAWWLARVQKAAHERPQQLDWGEQEHAAHGRVTARVLWLQKGGMALLAGGLILLGVALLVQFLL